MSEEEKTLFDCDPDWKQYWAGMPECVSKDLTPVRTMLVHFADYQDVRDFAEFIGQKITDETKFVWFPEAEIAETRTIAYTTEQKHEPRYPIYIISKGRWELRHTARSLEAMDIAYHIVVEPQELDRYAAVIDRNKILVLPFSNLGQGSIPARNWVWDHAVASGAKAHWILDDNIDGFWRLNNNLKVRVKTGATFCAAEDFMDRFENLAQCGFNYYMFAPRKEVIPAITINTRIYSCILIRNDVPYRWRGRYNEDTDLSIRMLKDGWCTVLFNAFLAKKLPTMTIAGGNTESLYQADGRLKMAQSLVDQHPDIVRVSEKWGRPQHHVDYSGFRFNRLKLRPGVKLPDFDDEYGMKIEKVR